MEAKTIAALHSPETQKSGKAFSFLSQNIGETRISQRHRTELTALGRLKTFCQKVKNGRRSPKGLPKGEPGVEWSLHIRDTTVELFSNRGVKSPPAVGEAL